MKAFESEQELMRYFRELAAKQKLLARRRKEAKDRWQ